MNTYKVKKVVDETSTAVYTATVRAENIEAAQTYVKDNDMTINWSEDQNELDNSELVELTITKQE